MRAVSRCPACRAFVEEGDRFCWSCGMGLGAAEKPSEVRPAQPAEEPDREAELAVRRAYLAQQRGELEEAERLLRGVLEHAPQNVSALSMLSQVLRERGDLVGAVAVAQEATEAAREGSAPPGAVEQAREGRAQIEARVVRESTESVGGEVSPVTLLASPGGAWYRSRDFYLALGALGTAALFLALAAALRGLLLGYVWLSISFLAAGWCYHDAETRKLTGLFWGPFVLFLGPFGLAVYLLVRY